MTSFNAKLIALARKQVTLAGPRYSPGIDVNAPNIAIEPLLLALGALALDDPYRSRLDELHASLDESLQYATDVKGLFARRRRSPDVLLATLRELKQVTPATAQACVTRVQQLLKAVNNVLTTEHARLDNQRQVATTEENQHLVDSAMVTLRRVQYAIEEVGRFAESAAFRLLTTNRLMILGEWGTGKTHFLCDITNQRITKTLPTLFVLAQHLPLGVDPLTAICQMTGVATSPKQLLTLLNQAGKARSARALLIVDGINEGDQARWRKALLPLSHQAESFPNVGFVLSCRRPFEKQIVSAHAAARWTQVEHSGFSNVAFDAQMEFFRYYEIPAPETPLLTDEFSRPLFLKILCETIRDLSTRSKKTYLKNLASGQKGMTRALEDFAKHIGAKIEQAFNLGPLTCWKIMKGDVVSGRTVGIAPIMASNVRDYITRPEAVAVLGVLDDLHAHSAGLPTSPHAGRRSSDAEHEMEHRTGQAI